MTIHMNPAWKMFVVQGNTALGNGNGHDALKLFAGAESRGLPLAAAAGHSAMALLLLGRDAEARQVVARALPHASGVFDHAQLLAVLAIADSLSGAPDDGALARLENCLLELTDVGMTFDLNKSDLRYLLRGLVRRHALRDRPRSVFRLLVAWPLPAIAAA